MLGNTFNMHAFDWRAHVTLKYHFENNIGTRNKSTRKGNNFNGVGFYIAFNNTFALDLLRNRFGQGFLDIIANIIYADRDSAID
jgi:hypothetical protein